MSKADSHSECSFSSFENDDTFVFKKNHGLYKCDIAEANTTTTTAGYHKVLILDCQNGSLQILGRKAFAASTFQPDFTDLRILIVVDQKKNPRDYKVLRENIPASKKRIPVFVNSKRKLSLENSDGARFWAQIRLDRLGTVDSLTRRIGGRRDLYVLNEELLSDMI